MVTNETWEQGGQKMKTVAAAAATGTQAQRNTVGLGLRPEPDATPLNSKDLGVFASSIAKI